MSNNNNHITYGNNNNNNTGNLYSAYLTSSKRITLENRIIFGFRITKQFNVSQSFLANSRQLM